MLKLLLIDNYDSFTYMLADYIRQQEVVCDVIRNDNTQLLSPEFMLSYHGLVLSPGPQTPKQAGYLMQVINDFHHQLPMLGICLGHQALGLYFGANLVKSSKPHHGKIALITQCSEHPILINVPYSFKVTRYHSLVLQQIHTPLKTLAITAQNEVMALAHNTLPLYGLQFHPESCLTPDGLTMIKNYITLVQQQSFLS